MSEPETQALPMRRWHVSARMHTVECEITAATEQAAVVGACQTWMDNAHELISGLTISRVREISDDE